MWLTELNISVCFYRLIGFGAQDPDVLNVIGLTAQDFLGRLWLWLLETILQ